MRQRLAPEHEVELHWTTAGELAGTSPDARRRSVAARRARTRAVLASLVRAYEPDAGVVTRPGSPPVVEGAELRLSVSHAGSIVAIAVSRRRPIGIDVEPLGRGVDDTLARHALSAGELEALQRLSPSNRGEAVLRAWVRKEAVLKAAGVGLLVEPSLVAVGIGRLAKESLAVPDHGLFRIVDLGLPGYVGALAAAGTAPLRGRWTAPPGHPGGVPGRRGTLVSATGR